MSILMFLFSCSFCLFDQPLFHRHLNIFTRHFSIINSSSVSRNITLFSSFLSFQFHFCFFFNFYSPSFSFNSCTSSPHHVIQYLTQGHSWSTFIKMEDVPRFVTTFRANKTPKSKDRKARQFPIEHKETKWPASVETSSTFSLKCRMNYL